MYKLLLLSSDVGLKPDYSYQFQFSTNYFSPLIHDLKSINKPVIQLLLCSMLRIYASCVCAPRFYTPRLSMIQAPCIVHASCARACVAHACVRGSCVRGSCVRASCVLRTSCLRHACVALRYVALRAFVEIYGNLWEPMGICGSLWNLWEFMRSSCVRASCCRAFLNCIFFCCKSSLHNVFALRGVFLLRFLRCRAFLRYVFCTLGCFFIAIVRYVAFFRDVFYGVLWSSVVFLPHFLNQSIHFPSQAYIF